MSYLPVIFVWGDVSVLLGLNLVRNRVLNSCRIWSTTQLNTPSLTPHPHSHTLSVYTVHLPREGGGGKVREKAQYTVRCDELKLTLGNLFLCYLIGIFS
jgi:hypothetical protein